MWKRGRVSERGECCEGQKRLNGCSQHKSADKTAISEVVNAIVSRVYDTSAPKYKRLTIKLGKTEKVSIRYSTQTQRAQYPIFVKWQWYGMAIGTWVNMHQNPHPDKSTSSQLPHVIFLHSSIYLAVRTWLRSCSECYFAVRLCCCCTSHWRHRNC